MVSKRIATPPDVLPSKDQRQKPNYKQQAAEELHRIQEKVILLNEMLLSLRPGDKVDKDDTIIVCDQPSLLSQSPSYIY